MRTIVVSLSLPQKMFPRTKSRRLLDKRLPRK
jgi:hypothetical protein